eukprot:95491_1
MSASASYAHAVFCVHSSSTDPDWPDKVRKDIESTNKYSDEIIANNFKDLDTGIIGMVCFDGAMSDYILNNPNYFGTIPFAYGPFCHIYMNWIKFDEAIPYDGMPGNMKLKEDVLEKLQTLQKYKHFINRMKLFYGDTVFIGEDGPRAFSVIRPFGDMAVTGGKICENRKTPLCTLVGHGKKPRQSVSIVWQQNDNANNSEQKNDNQNQHQHNSNLVFDEQNENIILINLSGKMKPPKDITNIIKTAINTQLQNLSKKNVHKCISSTFEYNQSTRKLESIILLIDCKTDGQRKNALVTNEEYVRLQQIHNSAKDHGPFVKYLKDAFGLSSWNKLIEIFMNEMNMRHGGKISLLLTTHIHFHQLHDSSISNTINIMFNSGNCRMSTKDLVKKLYSCRTNIIWPFIDTESG